MMISKMPRNRICFDHGHVDLLWMPKRLFEKPKRVSDYTYGAGQLWQNPVFWRSLGGEIYLGQPFSKIL